MSICMFGDGIQTCVLRHRRVFTPGYPKQAYSSAYGILALCSAQNFFEEIIQPIISTGLDVFL